MVYFQNHYQPYAVPYGYFGVFCDFVSIFIFCMLISGRSPCLFRKLKHVQAAIALSIVRLAGQSMLQLLNLLYARNHDLQIIGLAHAIFTFLAGVLIVYALFVRKTISFSSYLFPRQNPPTPPRQRRTGARSPPESTSASASSPVTEPPPPYSPRKDGDGTIQDFEMQNLGPSYPQAAAVNARLPSYTSSRLAAGASADGGELEDGRRNNNINTAERPTSATTRPRRQRQQRQQRRRRPCSLLPVAFFVLLSIVIVLCIGISELIGNVPQQLLNQGLREELLDTAPPKVYDKNTRRETNMIINLTLGGITILVAFIWSLYEHMGQAKRRGAEPGRVRDYFTKVIKVKDEGLFFWFLMASGMIFLCGYNISSADLLLGRVAGFRDGIVTFGKVQDHRHVARYWLYVVFGFLPFFSS
ncbi:hypothetical protein V8F33_010520 [Rhypophila sp. PSN 637]